MIDEEITSLLEDAGYQFNPANGRYDVFSGATAGEEGGHSTEFVADELGIPAEDLQRWEVEHGGGLGEEESALDAGNVDAPPEG